jgi:hypothetical protein
MDATHKRHVLDHVFSQHNVDGSVGELQTRRNVLIGLAQKQPPWIVRPVPTEDNFQIGASLEPIDVLADYLEAGSSRRGARSNDRPFQPSQE